ncbi:MAG: class I SAM-dependent methyltransferase [Candidatus Thiodiazotropha sp.]
MSKNYIEMNRAAWDQRTEAHFKSHFYDVPGFLSGKSSLREIEFAEMVPVEGRRLLHLQCHFGLDTLSWSRLGAVCTGVDLSPASIEKAQQLNRRAGLNARFICSDVYEYERGSEPLFDIVFTSYGTICWLPDLSRWADIVASNLAAGGIFYMADFHPVHDLVTGYRYFEANEPDIDEEGTYTENGSELTTTVATWPHPLSSVINALLNAGIQITRVNEYPFSPFNCFDGLEEREPGRFYFSHQEQDVPLVYTLTGEKAT